MKFEQIPNKFETQHQNSGMAAQMTIQDDAATSGTVTPAGNDTIVPGGIFTNRPLGDGLTRGGAGTWKPGHANAIPGDRRVLPEDSFIFVLTDEQISLDRVQTRPEGTIARNDGGTAALDGGNVIKKGGTRLPGGKAR